jgi:hypothetical protein
MDSRENYEPHYEAWKRRRAETDVPATFADRVMASVRGASVVGRRAWMRRAKAALSKSRTLQAAAYVAAAALLVLRIAALFAIFLPTG